MRDLHNLNGSTKPSEKASHLIRAVFSEYTAQPHSSLNSTLITPSVSGTMGREEFSRLYHDFLCAVPCIQRKNLLMEKYGLYLSKLSFWLLYISTAFMLQCRVITLYLNLCCFNYSFVKFHMKMTNSFYIQFMQILYISSFFILAYLDPIIWKLCRYLLKVP